LLDLYRQNREFEREAMAAVQRLYVSGQYILGREVEEFEAAVAQYLGVPDAIFVSSGTDALLVSLMALGIGPGDEVLCPSFSFFATAGVVTRLGATPVFVDVCPLCFNLSVTDAARRITPRTKAVIPVHLFGQSAEMDGLLDLAHGHDLWVVEDAAQAFGASYRGQMVGTIGDLGAISFFPTKNLGGWGDSGMVVGRDPELMKEVRIRRVHGMEPKYHHHRVGGNFRGDPVQAILLRLKLYHLERFNQLRADHAECYRQQLGEMDGVAESDPERCRCQREGEAAKGEPRLILPVAYPHNGHIWNQYTLRVPGKGRRDALRQWLQERQIGAEVYYPIPLHRQPCFEGNGAACPVADELAAEVLSIPVFPELEEPERARVIEAIGDFLAQG
jgi:dTDP-4-amino-4,6-dideoxygalactose transaminase